jgi:chaperonin cofactor prefoldin
MTPAIMEKVQQSLRSKDMDLKCINERLEALQRKMQERQQEMQQKLRHELSGEWAEI